MISKLEEGLSLTSVAQEFENDKSVLSRTWKTFHVRNIIRKVGCDWPWKTMASDDRYIVMQAQNDWSLTLGDNVSSCVR